MTSITTQARIDSAGNLTLQLPTGLPEGEAEVVVVVQPRQAQNGSWQAFVRKVAGSISDSTFLPQEFPELRETLA